MSNNLEQYHTERDEQYVAVAERCQLLAEMCQLVDYHPDHGRIPEHWQPIYREFFEAARALGALPGARTTHQDVVVPTSARTAAGSSADKSSEALEEKLAAALGWEVQPREPNELFHRWKRPSGTLREGRPHWTRDSDAAMTLAADLEIGITYRGALVIASVAGTKGGTIHVEEAIEHHRGKVEAMRTAIARAAVVKLETAMAPSLSTARHTIPEA